jgi:small ubiquitin-related modifier
MDKAKPDELNINVKSQEGNVICFKLKKTTLLKKMIESYCSKNGLHPKSVRFIFEGERIKDSDTPESLGMDDGDEIDAMVEQHGGF